jgi:hypothetical protein
MCSLATKTHRSLGCQKERGHKRTVESLQPGRSPGLEMMNSWMGIVHLIVIVVESKRTIGMISQKGKMILMIEEASSAVKL